MVGRRSRAIGKGDANFAGMCKFGIVALKGKLEGVKMARR
jgi:hypothetical protein